MDKVSVFFEACERGKRGDAEKLLGEVDLPSLIEKRTSDGRTCLHVAVISGDPDLLRALAEKLGASVLINMIRKRDEKGDTALHSAVMEDQVDLMKILVELDASLCDCTNKVGENPLKLAVTLGLEEAVEFLTPRTSNALHYIVQLNQVKLVEYIINRKVVLSNLINQGYKPATNPAETENYATNPSGNEGNRATNPHHVQAMDLREQQVQAMDHVVIGDTPLHIAARNKYGHMVNLLLKVKEVNKLIRNSENKTPFQIAREVTEYQESFGNIRKLGDFRRRPKPFMYCAPKMSHEKYKIAYFMLNKAYDERRNAELVVAALLAAMTCAALFTVPGGFNSDSPAKEDQGSPLLISLISFKLFIISDCIAFFLSLYVCIMWEMSAELTTWDKMLFLSFNSLVVCLSFGFSACGFMCAVYAMLARKVRDFSWRVLGGLIAITLCAVVAFIHQFLLFVVKRARADRLCGVCMVFNDMVEKVWCVAERCRLRELFRLGDDIFHDFITGHCKFKCLNSSYSSPSCCFNHV